MNKKKLKRMRLFILTMVFLITISENLEAQSINIKGFGEIPVTKKEDSYLIKIGKFGEFTFKGDLESQDLSADLNMEQLSNFPGFKVLSKLGLQNIYLNISQDGLFLNAQADTKSSLKKVCDLFRITTPYIDISAAIAPKSLDLEGNLEFSDGPVAFFSVKKTGTVVKFNSAQISSTLEAGSTALGFSTNLLIKPTTYDPELDCIYSFSYDLVTQTLTGSGSMMSTWVNPLGTSKFLDPETIVFSNAAIELGINVATLLPVNLGFAIEHGKLFTLDFAVDVSIDPVGKEVAFAGSREKMNTNDFTTFLREGFGLSVPDILPDIYYIDKPMILFSPNGGSVGEIKIKKNIALNGIMHIGDAIQGPVHFTFDMENELKLHMDLNYDVKKFVMNEARKIPVLAPVINEVLKTFQVRKLYVDLLANKDDRNFKGDVKCDFEVFGSSHNINFKAALNPEAIAQAIVMEIQNAAGPQLAVIADAVSQITAQSLDITSKAWGDASKFIGNASRHFTHSQKKCDNECVPNQARHLYAPILGGGNNALQVFHDNMLKIIVKIEGETIEETRRLRAKYIKNDWNKLTQKIENDWQNIRGDRTYVSFYLKPESATNGGHIYRKIINEKRKAYEAHKNALWQNMMNPNPVMGNTWFVIQNRWKNTKLHIENGPVVATEIGSGAHSSHWFIQMISGTDYVRIKNRWKNTYLQVNGNKVICSNINANQTNAMWLLEPLQGTEFIRIKNVKTNTYLNIESGTPTSDKIGIGAYSSHWYLNLGSPYKVTAPTEWSPGTTVLMSANKNYRLNFQKDGNLMLLKYNEIELWSSGSYGKGANRFAFQADGNIVVYNNQTAHWSANCHNKGGRHLILQDDGNLVVYNDNAIPVWATNTVDNNAVISFNPRTIVHDPNKGCGTIYKYWIPQKTHCGWNKTWHTVIMIGCIGNSTAENKLFLYDQGAGTAAIFKIDNNGNMHLLKDHCGLRKNWQQITWDSLNGCDGFIKFVAPDGYWETYKCSDSGDLTLHSKKQ